jgi:predicted transcriptional regulator
LLSESHTPSSEALLKMVAALANPHRLRVVAALAERRQYVSELARTLRISRPLVNVHLQKLQAAGLVTSTLEVSRDGKAMNYYEVTPFALVLTPQSIRAALRGAVADDAATRPDPGTEHGHGG